MSYLGTCSAADPNGGRIEWRREVALVCLLTLVAAGLRLIWFSGLHGHDDWVYLFYIRSYINGQAEELLGSLWGLRFLIWYPIYLCFKVFGVSHWGAFAPGFLLGLATIPLAWCAIRQLGYGIKIALLGGVFLIFNPIDWMVATTVRGDIEMSFYGGAILVFLLSMSKAEGRAKYAWGFATGVAWGLSALTKEWGYIFAWGFFAVALAEWIGMRRVPWAYVAVALGFALMWAADAALLRHLTGDWLRRVNASIEWYQRAADDGGYVGDPSVHHRYMVDLFFGLKTELTETVSYSSNNYPYYGPYMWLLIAALMVVGWRKVEVRLTVCFVLGLLLWVEFGSMSWRAYLPYHKEPRYFTFISVPAAVLMAVAAARVFRAETRRSLRIAVGGGVVAVLFAVVLVVDENHRAYRQERGFIPHLEAWLNERPYTRLWASGSIQQDLDLRLGYHFADPLHGHAGEPGWGSIQDLEFWPRREVGDLLLRHCAWGEFGAIFPAVNRSRLRHVAFVGGGSDVAEILEYVEMPRDAGGYWLSDAEPVSTESTYARPGWNRAFNDVSLIAGGHRHERGIGVHSRTELTFVVEPEFPVFSARIALLDSGIRGGSVVFSVWADDALLYRSSVVRLREDERDLKFDLGDARELRLVLDDAGDGPSDDHAAWLEPRMSSRSYTGSGEP